MKIVTRFPILGNWKNLVVYTCHRIKIGSRYNFRYNFCYSFRYNFFTSESGPCFLTQNTVSPRRDKIRFSTTTYISDTLVLLLNVFGVTPFPLLSYCTVSSLSCYVDSVLSPRVLHLLGRARLVTHDTSANMDWK